MKKRVITLLLVLPEEIISRLDLKSIINCTLVCKEWRKLISNLISDNPLMAKRDVQLLVYNSASPRFGALKTDQVPCSVTRHRVAWMQTLHRSYKPDPPEIEHIMSSCNGLVCFLGKHKKDIYICNPITGEHISFPNPKYWWDDHIHIPQYDLGFCPNRNEHKLTLFTWCTLDVYTLGSPSGWRSVPLEFPQSLHNMRPAICVAGVHHWFKNSQCILTFDLEEEVFGSIPPPPLEDDKKIYRLGCMDHCLVVTAGLMDPSLGLEVWARNEDRSSIIWTKKWVICKSLDQEKLYPEINFRRLMLQKLSSDGRIFMLLYDKYLYSYDPGRKLVRRHYTDNCIIGLLTYTPTLLSPKKLMLVSFKIEKKKRKLVS